MKTFTMNKKLTEFLNNKKNIYFGSKLNSKYLTSFNSTNSHVFYFNETFVVLTDSRYLAQAKKTIKHMEVLNISEKASWKRLFDLLEASQEEKIYLDENIITFKQLKTFKKTFAKNKLVPISGFDNIRLVKSASEIEKITFACAISDQIFAKIPSLIKVGMSEIELKNLIEIEMLKTKAPKTSFGTIVASGENSANPHWESGERVFQEGDAIIIDLGQYFQEYTSDITRTFFLGKISEKQKEVYNVVLEAQRLAINAIKPGIKVADLDKIARDYITEKGYKENFNHSLGHGIGIDIHEEPNLSTYAKDILEVGNVITIEPGIYLQNEFGIRIEDDILVTETGSTILNNSSKKITVI